MSRGLGDVYKRQVGCVWWVEQVTGVEVSHVEVGVESVSMVV